MTKGENIGYTAIYRYKRDKLRPEIEAKELYDENPLVELNEITNPAVKDRYKELALCDKIIELAAELGIEPDQTDKITKLDIMKLALAAMDKKSKILTAGQSKSTNVLVVNENVPEDPKLRSRARSLVKSIVSSKA
jgi:hypothetical protein